MAGHKCALLCVAGACTARQSGLPLRAQPLHSVGRRVALGQLSSALFAVSIAPAAASGADDAGDEAFGKEAYRAGSLFSRGQYADSERAWQRIVEAYPLRALGWQNLATVELINTAGAMRLDELPATGAAAARLEAAVAHFRRASTLAPARVDSLALNNEGNALGLLGRYDEALATYRVAADASARDFESIPRANAALTLLQLGRPEEGEKAAEAIVRRDPAFVDGFAIVAACRWARRDAIGAEAAYRRLCSEPTWCKLYASTDAVSGRWPPRAIETWSAFLAAIRP